MRIEQRSPDSLTPYEGNPRRIPKAAVDAVAQSIERYGFRQPTLLISTARLNIAVARREAYTGGQAERC